MPLHRTTTSAEAGKPVKALPYQSIKALPLQKCLAKIIASGWVIQAT